LVSLELLKDIDVHHGDGVQEAFLTTNRVCTLSFHQYDPIGNFFPGTGYYNEIGKNEGKYCSINVPLMAGLSDHKFSFIFQKVVDRVISKFRPDAIWMQCGADSLQGDPIGAFNLSIQAHSGALRHILSKNIPVIFSGGGGYNVQNVVRCWTYETMVICQSDSSDLIIPEASKYKNFFKTPDLFYLRDNIHGFFHDTNSDSYCSRILEYIFGNISKLDESVGFLEYPQIYNRFH
jgi:acetoin utilization deacetylase AcuC-like enzyme